MPGKYHTVIDYPQAHPHHKRSKFTLPALRKLQFFSTRSHNVGQPLRRRPSLFNQTNGGTIFRKNSVYEFSGRHEEREDTAAHKAKSVKRSQSFDSYFKKRRMNKEGENDDNNNNCQTEDENNEANEHKLRDMKREDYRQRATDTILEMDECREEMINTMESPSSSHKPTMEIMDNFKNETLSQIDQIRIEHTQAAIDGEDHKTLNKSPPAAVSPLSPSPPSSSLSTSMVTQLCDVLNTSPVPIAEPETTTSTSDSSEESTDCSPLEHSPSIAFIDDTAAEVLDNVKYADIVGNDKKTAQAAPLTTSQMRMLTTNTTDTPPAHPLGTTTSGRLDQLTPDKLESDKAREEMITQTHLPPQVVLRRRPMTTANSSPRKGQIISDAGNRRPQSTTPRPTSLILPEVSNTSPARLRSATAATTSGTAAQNIGPNYRRTVRSDLLLSRGPKTVSATHEVSTTTKPTAASRHLSIIETKSKVAVVAKVDHRRPTPMQSPGRGVGPAAIKYRHTEENGSTTSAAKPKPLGTIECTPLRRITRRQRAIEGAAIVQRLEIENQARQHNTSSRL